MDKNRFYFLLLIVLTWPLRYVPQRALKGLGSMLGLLVYILVPKFRKRTLSNLALASDLALSNPEIRRLAKASLKNLMITCLEYPKFARGKGIEKIMHCVNPQQAAELLKQGHPPIFFCGHLANWEVLFLEGTRRMSGVAIGRPIKNQLLYDWVVSIREQFGGVMITPKQAVKEGLRALKRGSFLGIVGDQGMPDSGYSSPFLGRLAWTSPLPALLSHKTGAPLIVATTHRDEKGHYSIHYSEPVWPNKEAPTTQEVDRLMLQCLHLLEEAIRKAPEQWLWCHNRWKQQTPEKLKKAFRHESILIALPENPPPAFLKQLGIFRHFYPREFLTVYAPGLAQVELDGAELLSHLTEDLRFKLLFNCTGNKRLNADFKRRSALTTLDLSLTEPLLEQLNTHLLRSHAC